MKRDFRKTAALGIIAASVAIGGISVYAAGEPENEEKSFFFKSGRPEKGFDAAQDAPESQGVPFGRHMRTRNADFSWAVEQAIISQETADEIAIFAEEKAEAAKAEMEKVRNAAPEERDAFFNERRETHTDLLEGLLEAGIITQTEAAALKEAMPQPEKRDMPEFGFGLIDGERPDMKNVAFGGMGLEALVESGVIDQATSESIKSYLEKRMEELQTEIEEMRANMDGMAAMSKEERRAMIESGTEPAEPRMAFSGGKRFDILGEMVEQGIITQAQADAIKEAMPHSIPRSKP